MAALESLDLNIFHSINQIAGRFGWLDRFVVFFAVQAIVVLAVLVILLWFMDFGLDRKKNRYAVVMAIEALILARLILTPIIRELLPRVRPFVENNVNLLISQSPLEPGFPSGHAVMAFALALPVFVYNRKAGTWLLFLALLISLSRVFVGVHYPGDIAFGFILSFLVVLFINFFRDKLVAPVVKKLSREK
ncbi:MAG: hypothetical protein A3J48_04075 [Candidatus Doudnabacteria bacterium RIFCSPHIGHO2_02_FULL_46_11]|uniref:Phosphatidic acid phosphatase type 2/haloperoxidase domain-containing protein n=1 Tax=Candidatus Doudnabacteria bacterium RIFCSPHIGHO2_02_FULL_46_11 TaxID=1817832 RepID=A0A1F5P786_9BACT|nr:MAG: hypothetical protein A3J48_04075 [Candidatus Doudnabacteria bacterium RIFCSPHIGHO2_02_FULL_46_11]